MAYRRPGPRSTPAGGHLPVFLPEVLAALQPSVDQTIVDCTVGAGGHSTEIAKRIGPSGTLIGIDFDADILAKAEASLAATGTPFHLTQGNFAGLAGVLAGFGIETVDGILADLGVSSPQIDDAERGFSYMREGPLDMRMDRSRNATAADLLAKMTFEQLVEHLRDLGDEPMAEEVAEAILDARDAGELQTTRQLTRAVRRATSPGNADSMSPRDGNLASVARVFQTLRILVNRELANLDHLLRTAPTLLRPGARIAIISFHSGEDRRVKQAFRDGLRGGIYRAVSTDPIVATPAAVLENPRSRSAKLRWAELA